MMRAQVKDAVEAADAQLQLPDVPTDLALTIASTVVHAPGQDGLVHLTVSSGHRRAKGALGESSASCS